VITDIPRNLARAPVSETLFASKMAGTSSAPAIAQAPDWDSPQLVTEFEKAPPAKDVEKLEYMNLRAPADIGSTTYFPAMEGTMAATKQGDLAVRSKIMTPGPCEETTQRIGTASHIR
jgi:hypothetical protein